MASVCNWDRVQRKNRQKTHKLQKVACVVCGETFETFHKGLIQRAKYCGTECRNKSKRQAAKAQRDQARAERLVGGWRPNAIHAQAASAPGQGAPCGVCGLPVGTRDKRVRYCSEECRQQYTRAQDIARVRKWQSQNPEAKSQNPEAKRAIRCRWKQAHPERVRADAKRHYAAHTGRIQAQRRERQAALCQSALADAVQTRLAALRDAVTQKVGAIP